MDKETLDLELKELTKTIRKAQAKARPFNKIIREARKRQTELQRKFRKKRIAENKARKEAERLARKQCAKTWGDLQCSRTATFGDYCKLHSPSVPRCAADNCTNIRPADSMYCKRHDPDYEYVLVDKHRNHHQWLKKGEFDKTVESPQWIGISADDDDWDEEFDLDIDEESKPNSTKLAIDIVYRADLKVLDELRNTTSHPELGWENPDRKLRAVHEKMRRILKYLETNQDEMAAI